nr:ATP synthase F0 subunit 6 [Tubifex tubifex]
MMPDIFSSFDPYSFKSFIPSITAMLLITPSMFILMNMSTFPAAIRKYSSMTDMINLMFTQLMRTQSKSLKGTSLIISSSFLMIIFINLIGMSPYVFSLSSHLVMTLSLGLPMWAAFIISSWMNASKASAAHLLPEGAPDWLNPFLVMIESVSVSVRPLTLSFRLAANMTAGHIVLGLISIYGASALLSSFSTLMLLIPLSMGYITFELAICLIQAYIFCLLLSLYSDDHAN